MQVVVLTDTQNIYTVNILTVLQERHTHTYIKHYFYGHIKDGKIRPKIKMLPLNKNDATIEIQCI